MLKNLTIGQYYPIKSTLHSLDPRTKLVLCVLYMVCVFAFTSVWGLVMIAAFNVAAVMLSNVPLRLIIKSYKPILIFISITALLNLFLTPGEPIFSFYFLTVTWEGVNFTILMILRIFFLITATTLLTLTTTPIMLTDAMESLMSPLKRIGFPAHAIAMMMTIALRFIPTLLEETEKLMKAQSARGADFETGSIMKRIKAVVPLLVPLFVSSIRRAEDLAVAMETRCYRGDINRTKMKVLKMSARDYVAYAIFAFYFSAVLLLQFLV